MGGNTGLQRCHIRKVPVTDDRKQTCLRFSPGSDVSSLSSGRAFSGSEQKFWFHPEAGKNRPHYHVTATVPSLCKALRRGAHLV